MRPSLEKTKPHRAWTYLKLAISFGLVILCLSYVDLPILSASVSQASAPLVALAFLVNITGTIGFRSLYVWRLLSQSFPVRYYKVLVLNLILRFYTIILPRTVVSAIRWHKYKQISNGSTSLVTLSVETLVSLLLLAAGGTLMAIVEHEKSEWLWLPGLALTCLLSAGIVIIFLLPRKAIQSLHMKHQSRTGWSGKLVQYVSRWYEAVHSLNSFGKANYLFLMVGAIGNYLLFIISSYLLALALGIQISFYAIGWIRSFVLILAHAPFTIAGIGVRELGLITLLSLYSVTPSLAMAYAALAFAIQLLIGGLGGLLHLSNYSSRVRTNAKE